MSKGRIIGAVRRSASAVDRLRVLAAPRASATWIALGILALQASGLIQLTSGVLAVPYGLSRIPAQGPFSITLLLVAGGLALIVSGTLTLFRRRRELVYRILGALTTASWALALAFLSRDGGDAAADGLLTLAVILGTMLLVTFIFSDLLAIESASSPDS